MKKTLIVDGQLFQTNAFFRGMGGYAYNLVRTFAQQQPDVRIMVVLNQRMLHDEGRLAGIQQKIPTAELHLIDLPFQPMPQTGEEARAVAALDAFIAEQAPLDSHEVHYFIPALFLFDFCAVFPSDVKKLLLFHDLTPLIFRDDMAKYFPGHLYFPRFATIFEADIIFTNSLTTGRDLEVYLGVDPAKMVNIDGSLNTQPVPDADKVAALLGRLGLKEKPFLLMPTGGTEFKNNIRAAQALRNLKRDLTVDIKIVVTSFFQPFEKEELRLIAGDDMIFTDNITTEELMGLFSACQAVLLPSLYEGLGLPVLEGISHDKPVACSDIAVFREIPHFREALYVFDPYDVDDIAEAMLRAVSHAGFSLKRTFYPAIMEKYSWPSAAERFAAAIEEAKFFEVTPALTRKVAVLCPDPRKNNDVAVFAQRMYGYGLRAGIEFTYFIDPGGDDDPTRVPLPDYVRSIARSYDIKAVYDRLADEHFNQVIHFMSGDARFTHLYRAVASIPGYLYIGNEGYHDTVEALQEAGMLSPEQYTAESQLFAAAQAHKAFATPVLLAQAKGVIVERHAAAKVRKALKVFELDVPLLELPECSVVNFDREAFSLQAEAYGQVFAFIEGKR